MRHLGRMCAILTALALAGACSTAAKHVDEIAQPSHDEAPATGAVVPADANIDDAVTAADANLLGTFEWQKIRDAYEAFKKTPVGSTSPCDHRLRPRDRPRGIECLPPFGPFEQAAIAHRAKREDLDHTRVALDLGSDDGISIEWVAALVDEHDRVVSSWVPVTWVSPKTSEVVLDVFSARVAPRAHVAMKRTTR